MAQSGITNIENLEKEIASLPPGSITKKTIHGRTYYYHRVTADKKRKEVYLSPEEADALRPLIARRKELEKELRSQKKSASATSAMPARTSAYDFLTHVRTGASLKAFASPAKGFKKRALLAPLKDYVLHSADEKVLILYGLRRTGKTTLIRQMFLEMRPGDLERTAFIQITAKDTLAEVNRDLKYLEDHGFRYVFLDEVTLMEDFIDGAALFSDVYAPCGMRIVLSGTDSLGFAFTEGHQLYDRCIMLHTTYIPYREFASVLGILSVDEYIRYGGTMTPGGTDYNAHSAFTDSDTTDEYVNTAIAGNIQHALRLFQDGKYLRNLRDLFEAGELTNAINRIIQTLNHEFTARVITEDFRSRDLGSAAQLLRSARDKEKRSTALDEIDKQPVIKSLMQTLEIINRENQTIGITKAHIAEIKEYLQLLDLIAVTQTQVMTSGDAPVEYVIFTQPGMRFCHAEALIASLMENAEFSARSERDKNLITEKILDDVRGIMLQDIVLLETIRSLPKKKRAFRLLFASAEIDMVIYDEETDTCTLYEIKHSSKQHPAQYRHLTDKRLAQQITKKYGEITGRYVLYQGKDETPDNGVIYLNVEGYLTGV